MRHEAIEMVCAHVGQGKEAPPHNWGVLGVLTPTSLYSNCEHLQCNIFLLSFLRKHFFSLGWVKIIHSSFVVQMIFQNFEKKVPKI
jgi:hypothetical protein